MIVIAKEVERLTFEIVTPVVTIGHEDTQQHFEMIKRPSLKETFYFD